MFADLLLSKFMTIARAPCMNGVALMGLHKKSDDGRGFRDTLPITTFADDSI